MPSGMEKDAVSGRIEWSELVMVVEGIIEQPDSRRQRLENLKKLRRFFRIFKHWKQRMKQVVFTMQRWRFFILLHKFFMYRQMW